MVTILSFIFVLGILVLVHELGHFIMAKIVGIRVERFSLGFPPRMIGKKIGETDYCISWIPIGGYVKMAGMIDESMDKDSIKGEPWEFMSKPIYQKLIVIIGGSLMNFLLAIFIFSALTFFRGIAEPVGPVVGEVFEGTPAAEIGLQVGDRIISVNGEEIHSWDDLTRAIHSRPEQLILIEWLRNDEKYSHEVTPILDKIQQIGLIGIGPKTQIRSVGIFEAGLQGLSYSYFLTKLVIISVKMIVTGEESIKSALAGPIFIAKMAGETARSGFENLLAFMAFLSLNLGFLNLLPIPVLDGGHLVFIAVEGVLRRPISVKTKLVIQQVGMALLLALMIFIIINDIKKVW